MGGGGREGGGAKRERETHKGGMIRANAMKRMEGNDGRWGRVLCVFKRNFYCINLGSVQCYIVSLSALHLCCGMLTSQYQDKIVSGSGSFRLIACTSSSL